MKYLKSFNESNLSNYMNKLTKDIIDSWKPIFDYYPTLTAIPIYAWGRYDRSYMESSGQKIDDEVDDGMVQFIKSYSPKYNFDIKLLDEISKGKFGDDIINREFEKYTINRRKIVYEFGRDDIGYVTCLILEKGNSGFKLLVIEGE